MAPLYTSATVPNPVVHGAAHNGVKQGYTNSSRLGAHVTEYYAVVSNIFGFSVWNLM